MDTQLQHTNEAIITRYTDQPIRLPAELRRAIEERWDGAPVQLYALADLNQALYLAETWVALGAEPRWRRRGAAATAGSSRTCGGPAWRRCARRRGCRPRRSRSSAGRAIRRCSWCATRTASARAFENIRFVLDEALAGRGDRVPDADREYAEAVARPVRDAQALVAGQRVAVIRRLLGYLRPVPAAGDLRHVGGGGDHAGEPRSAVPRGLPDRPRGAAGAGRDAVARRARDASPGSRWRRWRWCTWCVRRRRMVRLRLMSILGELVARDLRAELYEHIQRPEPRVLLAQEDGKPDHARDGRHRPAVGVPRVRRRGRVAVARDADRASARCC